MESNRLEARPKGRPRIGHRTETLTHTKPWEVEGMSERTWYRRQRERRIRDFGLAAVERELAHEGFFGRSDLPDLTSKEGYPPDTNLSIVAG